MRHATQRLMAAAALGLAVGAAAPSNLAGAARAQARRLRSRRERFPSPDQAARRRKDWGREEDIRSASRGWEGRRRQPWRSPGSTPAAAAARGLARARAVPREETSPGGRE